MESTETTSVVKNRQIRNDSVSAEVIGLICAAMVLLIVTAVSVVYCFKRRRDRIHRDSSNGKWISLQDHAGIENDAFSVSDINASSRNQVNKDTIEGNSLLNINPCEGKLADATALSNTDRQNQRYVDTTQPDSTKDKFTRINEAYQNEYLDLSEGVYNKTNPIQIKEDNTYDRVTGSTYETVNRGFQINTNDKNAYDHFLALKTNDNYDTVNQTFNTEMETSLNDKYVGDNNQQDVISRKIIVTRENVYQESTDGVYNAANYKPMTEDKTYDRASGRTYDTVNRGIRINNGETSAYDHFTGSKTNDNYDLVTRNYNNTMEQTYDTN